MSDPTDFDATEPDAMSFDADGDGYAESTVIDTDGDAIADTFIEEDPYTGAMAVASDTDGDGMVDTVAVDVDGDGLIDDAVVDDTVDSPADPTTTDVPFTEDGPDLPDEGSDPALDEGFHGDPPGDMTYHQTQPGPVDCVPTSVAMTLSDLTGQDIEAGEVVDLANESGFMTESGMAAEDALTLFEHYDVDAELTSGSIDGLREALDNGDSIVVGLDAADLYSGGGGPFDEGLESGHAVVITGIDDGPPGTVYINDPGFPDGAGVEIPLDQFEDSWEDTDNTMIVAEASVTPEGGDAEAAESGDDEASTDAISRMILLPLNFVVGS